MCNKQQHKLLPEQAKQKEIQKGGECRYLSTDALRVRTFP